MILWKRPCWKDKYLVKDLEANGEGDGKIVLTYLLISERLGYTTNEARILAQNRVLYRPTLHAATS